MNGGAQELSLILELIPVQIYPIMHYVVAIAMTLRVNSGCSGMYTDFTNNQIQSVRFDYSYAAASGGPGIVAGNCMSGSSSSLYKEAIIDWSNGGSPWAECSNGTVWIL